jgi:hypothetical protein
VSGSNGIAQGHLVEQTTAPTDRFDDPGGGTKRQFDLELCEVNAQYSSSN